MSRNLPFSRFTPSFESSIVFLLSGVALFLLSCEGTTADTRLETRASIEGKVVLVDVEGLNDFSRVKVDIGRGEGGVAPEEDGNFRFGDLEADYYSLVITYNGGLSEDAEGSAYQRYEQGVTAFRGSVTSLGEIRLSLGQGTIHGVLSLPEGVSPGTIRIELTGNASFTTNPAGDGAYQFDDVPVGRYSLFASGADLIASVCSGPDVIVGWDGQELQGPTFGLNGTSVALSAPDATLFRGMFLTGNSSLTLQATAPFAREARFWTGDAPGDYLAFDETLTVTGLNEGSQTVRVQFRDACGFESEILEKIIVSDTLPPALTGLSVGDGSSFVTSEDGATVLNVTCVDASSEPARLSFKIGEGAWQSEDYTPSRAIDLGDTEGEYAISAKCADRVGHESPEMSETVLWDHTPPQEIEVRIGDDSGFITEINPWITITGDSISWMQVGTESGLAAVPWQPYSQNHQVVFSAGDGTKELFLRFRDAAGNRTEEILETVVLDTKGQLTGSAFLENGEDFSGITVALSGTSFSATTDSEGGWTMEGVPQGRYILTASHAGYDAQSSELTVVARQTTEVPGQILPLSRGSIAGKVELQGQNDSGGVLVEIQETTYSTLTTSQGDFLLSAVPANTYTIVASKAGHLRTTKSGLTVESGEVTPAGTLILEKLTGSFQINDGARYTQTRTVVLTLAFNQVNAFRWRAGQGDFSEWVAWDDPDADGRMVYGVGGEVLIASDQEEEGEKTLQVETRDIHGIPSGTPYYASSILLDSTPPQGIGDGVVINNGAPLTKSSVVQVALTAAGATQMQVGCNGALTNAVWVAYSPGTVCNVGSGNGADPEDRKSVVAIFRDEAHNVAYADPDTQTPFSGDILVDDTAPVDCEIVLQEDAQYVKTPGVSLKYRCENSTLVRIGGQILTPSVWQDYTWAEDHQGWVEGETELETALSGFKTVEARFRDAAGNESTAAFDQIYYDGVGPTLVEAGISAPFLKEGDGGRYCLNGSFQSGIPISISAWDSDSGLRVVEARHQALAREWSSWSSFPHQPTILYPMPSETGDYRLEVRVRDKAGNESETLSLAFRYDTQAPDLPQLLLNEGAAWTKETEIVASVTLSDSDLTGYQILLSGNFPEGSGVVSMPLTSPMERTLTLTSQDGPKTILAVAVDPAGNLSLAASATITLDTTPPWGMIGAFEGGARYVNTVNTSVELTCTDNLSLPSELWVRVVSGDYGDFWQPFIPLVAFPVSEPDEDGMKKVAITFKDAAGNETETTLAGYEYDHTSPNVNAQVNDGATLTNRLDAEVEIQNRSSDTAAVAFTEETLDCDDPQISYVYPPGGTVSYRMTEREGWHQIYLCAKDFGPNFTSRIPLNPVFVDTLPPQPGRLNLAEGKALVNLRTVSIEAPLPSGESTALIRLGGDVDSAFSTNPYWIPTDEDGVGGYDPLPASIDLTTGDGEKVIWAYLTDEAGNSSPTFMDSVRVDTLVPPRGVLKVNGQAWSDGDPAIPIENATAAVEIFRHASDRDPADGGAAYVVLSETLADLGDCRVGNDACQPISGSRTFAFSTGIGPKVLYYRYFDLALNGSDEPHGEFHLNLLTTQAVRPIPVLEEVTPSSITALEDSYTLTVVGSRLATDSRLRIGDFELSALCTGVAAPPGVTCTDANLEGDSCDGDPTCRNCCQVSIDSASPAWALTRNAGSYIVRVVTPEPVEGTGVSEETDFLYIVAPMPKILDFTVLEEAPEACRSGEIDACRRPIWNRRYFMDSEVEQGGEILLWGHSLADNLALRLEGYYFEVKYVGPDLENPMYGEIPRQVVVASVGSVDLPARELPYALTAVNPTPGGGESSVGFGINWSRRPIYSTAQPAEIRETDLITPLVTMWSELYANPFDSPNSDTLETSPDLYFSLLSTRGFGAVRDHEGALAYRFPANVRVGFPLGADTHTFELQSSIGSVQAQFQSFPGMKTPTGVLVSHSAIVTGRWDTCLMARDLNGDRIQDFVVTDAMADTVKVYLGNGDATFQPAVAYPVGDWPNWISIQDMNGDRQLDLVIANTYTKDLSLLFGNGDGTFQNEMRLRVPGKAGDLEIADFNNDRIMDLAVIYGAATNPLSILLGIGDGRFGDPIEYFLGANPMALVSADWDGDARADLAVRTDTGTHILIGDGTGHFISAGTYIPDWYWAGNFAQADLNKDGAPDLLYAQIDKDRIGVLIGNGDGTFEEGGTYATGDEPFKIRLGDLNGDGWTDVIASERWGAEISILYGKPDGTFLPKVRMPFSVMPPDSAIADLNGDAVPDLAVLYQDAWEGYGTARLSLYLGQGEAMDETPPSVPLGADTYWAAAGDFNRDGRPDVAVNDRAEGKMRVILADSDGSLMAPVSYTLEPNAWGPIVSGDVNGDGLLDLATPAVSSDQITLLKGNGDGTFQARVNFSTGDGPGGIYMGDVNGDGKADIVSGCVNSGGVRVHLGNGDGTFVAQPEISVGNIVATLSAGDVNGDGRMDLILSLTFRMQLLVFLGLGDGSFVPQAPVPVGKRPYGVVLGDFNADGALDLATANVETSDVSVLLGNGDGSFQPEVRYETGYPPHASLSGREARSLAVSDFDGDGALDLVTPNPFDAEISVLRGNGDGTFNPQVRYPTGEYPTVSLPGDWNRDGVDDLLSVHRTSQTASLIIPRLAPGPVEQNLSDLPTESLAIPEGITEFRIHQGIQDLEKLTVRFLVRFAEEPVGEVRTSLTAPDGRRVSLGLHSVFTPWPSVEEPTEWHLRMVYPTAAAPLDDLSDLYGVQPPGDWILSIDNGTGLVGEFLEFGLTTLGRPYGPKPGDRTDWPEAIHFPEGRSTRWLQGRTLGFRDKASLSCATTHAADLDGDGWADGAPDHLYQFTLLDPQRMSIRAVAGFDSALELRRGTCQATPATVVACDDNGFSGKNPALNDLDLEVGTYCLVVDGVYSNGGSPADPTDDALAGGEYDLFLLDACNGHGTWDPEAEVCLCDEGFDGAGCDACATGFFDFPVCRACNGHGEWDAEQGVCRCDDAFGGAWCDACADGYFDYPDCREDPCPALCNGNGDCDSYAETCACYAHYVGDTCDACAEGYINYPDCVDDGNPCTPNPCTGSKICNPSNGSCECPGGTEGTHCERCRMCYTESTEAPLTCEPVEAFCQSSAPHLLIPDNNASGVMPPPVLYLPDSDEVEQVCVRVRATHRDPEDLMIEIQAPMGYRTTIKSLGSGAGTMNLDASYTVTLPYPISAVGPWTLFISDRVYSFMGGTNYLEAWSVALEPCP